MKGGCACGAIRYHLDAAPYDTGWCHCRLCQRTSAAPAIVFTTVARHAFVLERGDPACFRSSETGERQFCRDCGTLLTIHVDFQPEDIDVAAATLDDPNAVTPGFHIFYGQRVAWAVPGDDLPRHDRWRPSTRGLG